jgi:hypothetical protein
MNLILGIQRLGFDKRPDLPTPDPHGFPTPKHPSHLRADLHESQPKTTQSRAAQLLLPPQGVSELVAIRLALLLLGQTIKLPIGKVNGIEQDRSMAVEVMVLCILAKLASILSTYMLGTLWQ